MQDECLRSDYPELFRSVQSAASRAFTSQLVANLPAAVFTGNATRQGSAAGAISGVSRARAASNATTSDVADGSRDVASAPSSTQSESSDAPAEAGSVQKSGSQHLFAGSALVKHAGCFHVDSRMLVARCKHAQSVSVMLHGCSCHLRRLEFHGNTIGEDGRL